MRRKTGLDLKKLRAYHRRPSSEEKTPVHSYTIYHSDVIGAGSTGEGHKSHLGWGWELPERKT